MRADARQLQDLWSEFGFLKQSIWRAILHDVEPALDAVAQLIQILDAERPCHALFTAEYIDQHRHIVSAHMLEEQRWPASFAHSISDLGNLQFCGDGSSDALKLPLLFEQRDKLA